MANETTFTFIFDSVASCFESALSKDVDGVAFCKALRQNKRSICEVYSAVNTSVKNAYMRDPRQPLDRHKCAACFMVAFLEKFPMFETKLNKERVAISIGMLLLKIFIYQECTEITDLTFIDFIEEKGKLQFPKCSCDTEPYEDNWALGIHYDRDKANNTNVKMLSALSLSNVLFLIEQHNRHLMKIESLEMP
jgi:hypothetical protein